MHTWLGVEQPTPSIPQSVPASLREIANGDAFVWRKLECVQWRTIAWEACAAQSNLLTAINVDARNIVSNSQSYHSFQLYSLHV